MANSAHSRLSPSLGARDHVLGPPDAAVTLVEYGDYECLYCSAAHPVTKQIESIMGSRLRFAFRHFPLAQIHPHAEMAAEAAEAAGEQGYFWDMHSLLFENQRTLDHWNLLRFARGLGLDMDRFARELQECVHLPRVREDFMSGVRSGVSGTPTFFINGVRYDGSWELGPLLGALERKASNSAERLEEWSGGALWAEHAVKER